MIETLQQKIEKWFSKTEYGQKRYIHTLGVVKMALKLNEINNFNVDQNLIITAALLHDVGKMMSQAEMLKVITENKTMLNISDDEFEVLKDTPNVWHAYASVYLAVKQFKITNEDILTAIKYHTTGKAEMSELTKLIYIADTIEENRTYQGVEKYRELVLKNFDLGLIVIMRDIIKMLKDNNEVVHPFSQKALEYYERIEEMTEKKFDKIVYDVVKVLDKAVVFDTVVYDMSEITPFYDYSVITSSNTSRQGNAAIDYLRDEAPKLGLSVHSFSTSPDAKWLLVDLGKVVVHVFVGEERIRYRLDDLYSSLPNEKFL